MLTREGSEEVKEIKMFRPLHQHEASTSSVQSSQSKSRRVSQVIVCSNCHYEFCLECLAKSFSILPLEVKQIILQKWFDSNEAKWSYTKELPYRIRPWRVYYALSREPNPVYFGCIQQTDWTWVDYFSIHQRARIHGSVKVIFYALAIDPSRNWWSPWFRLFLFRYIPRDRNIFYRTFVEFCRLFHWEMHVAVQNDFFIEFEFVHRHTKVIPIEESESFKLCVSFRGVIIVDEQDRPPYVYTFPFFCCTREEAPYWLDESVPYEALAPDIDALLERQEEERREREHDLDYDDGANSD